MTQDVTNPGSVNVANQAFGRGLGAGQSQSVTPPTNAGPLVDVADQGDGELSVDQAVTVTPSQIGQRTVDGGLYSPQGPKVINTTPNTVIGQLYGNGQVIEVYV
ncbi:MAG: hypothetical protein ABSB49_21740 [Polyangia bacterium]